MAAHSCARGSLEGNIPVYTYFRKYVGDGFTSRKRKSQSSIGAMVEDVGILTPTGDKLILRGLKFHGFHGVKPEGKKLGQKFLVDADAWMDLWTAVKEVVEGQSRNLLESVAQIIASTIFTKHSQISAVRVKVGKPHVAVHGPLDYLGVEIIRHRSIDASN